MIKVEQITKEEAIKRGLASRARKPEVHMYEATGKSGELEASEVYKHDIKTGKKELIFKKTN